MRTYVDQWRAGLRKVLPGILIMLVLVIPARVAGREMSPAVEEALALCSTCASLPTDQLEAARDKVRRLLDDLQAEAAPANKVWIFRLERCASFLDFRLEAAEAADAVDAQTSD